MIGVELLTVLGGVLTSGIFIPPFALKRKREAAMQFLKNEEAKSNARYSSYNLKQGHLDNACEHDIADINFRLLRRVMDQFSWRASSRLFARDDSILEWYFSELLTEELPDPEKIREHLCYCIIHWDDDPFMRKQLEKVITQGALAKILLDEKTLPTIARIDFNVSRLNFLLAKYQLGCKQQPIFSETLESHCLRDLLDLVQHQQGRYMKLVKETDGSIDNVFSHFCWRVLNWYSYSTSTEVREELSEIISREKLAGILADELLHALRNADFEEKKGRYETEGRSLMYSALWEVRSNIFRGVLEERCDPAIALQHLVNLYHLHGYNYRFGPLKLSNGDIAEIPVLEYLLQGFRWTKNIDAEIEIRLGEIQHDDAQMWDVLQHYVWRVVHWNDEEYTSKNLKYELERIATQEGLASFLLKEAQLRLHFEPNSNVGAENSYAIGEMSCIDRGSAQNMENAQGEDRIGDAKVHAGKSQDEVRSAGSAYMKPSIDDLIGLHMQENLQDSCNSVADDLEGDARRPKDPQPPLEPFPPFAEASVKSKRGCCATDADLFSQTVLDREPSDSDCD